jgi:CheY-like chemotaxis protein
MAKAKIRRDIALGFAWRKEGMAMTQSLIYDKRILIVDNDPNFIPILERKVREASPNCKVDIAGTYLEAVEEMVSWTYDLVIMGNIVGSRSSLLDTAEIRKFPIAVLGSDDPPTMTSKQTFQMRAKAYFPKEKMNQIIAFVQDSLGCESRPRWEFLLKKIIGFRNPRGPGYREQHVRLKS